MAQRTHDKEDLAAAIQDCRAAHDADDLAAALKDGRASKESNDEDDLAARLKHVILVRLVWMVFTSILHLTGVRFCA